MVSSIDLEKENIEQCWRKIVCVLHSDQVDEPVGERSFRVVKALIFQSLGSGGKYNRQ